MNYLTKHDVSKRREKYAIYNKRKAGKYLFLFLTRKTKKNNSAQILIILGKNEVPDHVKYVTTIMDNGTEKKEQFTFEFDHYTIQTQPSLLKNLDKATVHIGKLFFYYLDFLSISISNLSNSDGTFKIADKVKRRKKNESIIETTQFKQTIIISIKTTLRDENDKVRTEVVPLAYIHMDSKSADAYKRALADLLEIHKDYSDDHHIPKPGKFKTLTLN